MRLLFIAAAVVLLSACKEDTLFPNTPNAIVRETADPCILLVVWRSGGVGEVVKRRTPTCGDV
ncbi:MAG: hypothetical protein J0I31_03185 [Rhizobiales bacterium]|nr:hypothetical protein [Hyphomicrobiales bacterium]